MTHTFNTDGQSFFKELKSDVEAHFERNKLHPAGNGKLYIKGIIQILSALVLYIILVFFTPAVLISILLCILLGFNLAVIGFNVMHEGGHQTFSRYRSINQLSAYFLNILGGISYYWKIKHNINHHTYTNIEGMDSDIDVKPFMRLHAGQPWKPHHRFQHVYWLPLYGVSYLAWVFYEDFLKYFRKSVASNGRKTSLPRREHYVFWFTKVMYLLAYVAIPIWLTGFIPWLIGFLIITVVCGITTSVVFQLAHVVEGTQFHDPVIEGETGKQSWALHQIASTSNFGTSSGSLHWLLGGLNFQIEHHLFPRVSHIHYPEVSSYVKAACTKEGIRYHEHPTFSKALSSHIRHLRTLGAQPVHQKSPS